MKDFNGKLDAHFDNLYEDYHNLKIRDSSDTVICEDGNLCGDCEVCQEYKKFDETIENMLEDSEEMSKELEEMRSHKFADPKRVHALGNAMQHLIGLRHYLETDKLKRYFDED